MLRINPGVTQRGTQGGEMQFGLGNRDGVGRTQGYRREPSQRRKESDTLCRALGHETPRPSGGLGRLCSLEIKSLYLGIKHCLYLGLVQTPTLSSAVCPECFYWQFFLQLPSKTCSKVTLPPRYKLELLCWLPKSHWINFLPYLIRNSSLNRVCKLPWLIFRVLDLHIAVPALFLFSG